MIMNDRKKVYVNTGGEEDSGIDLISTTTNRVCPLSNYDLLPFSTKIVESKGGSMRLHPGEDLLRGYWQQFGNESEYHVHMEESDSFRPVVVTRHGGRIVGGIFRYKNGGALVALPWINFDREEFYDEGQRAEDDDVDADTYRDSDSEFDAVLECPEGRCIGEAEGRDNKPISIEKMRQLFLNIHEDLSREEISCPAKGILFGNAYRLSPPSDRPAEHFTPKCMTAAKGNGTALIRTCDLFEIAKALVDEPDEEFAALCRKAIFNTVGEEVKFPARPEAKASKCQDAP